MAVLAEQAEIVPFLTEMELEFEGLVEAARYGDRERALCSANDPRGFELILMNAKVARGLREIFCSDRWAPDETDNQPGIRNPFLKVRVIPCNFDENAGNQFADPTNRTEKGAASKKKVRCNATPWIPGLIDPTETEEDGSEYTTFLLGTYFDSRIGLRAELARPKAFSSGQYKRFETRVMLLDGSEDFSSPIGSKIDRGGPTEIIDIAVKRK
ncbi:MAG: hypothetical protein JWR80_5507 [Bradyrhizobium sp.]|nr:hypothetical protein [Bradyrhizobium sp.]